LSYQWQKNNVAFRARPVVSYKTPKATAADNGSTYRVFVTNAAGTVSSNSATLTVR
jgi:hypothetical protein